MRAQKIQNEVRFSCAENLHREEKVGVIDNSSVQTLQTNRAEKHSPGKSDFFSCMLVDRIKEPFQGKNLEAHEKVRHKE